MYLMVWFCTRVRNESKKKKRTETFQKIDYLRSIS